jgi:hypothetical protein
MRRALIGRLMIHAFFVAHHGCSWAKLEFSRSEANKPILVSAGPLCTWTPIPSDPSDQMHLGEDNHSGAGQECISKTK